MKVAVDNQGKVIRNELVQTTGFVSLDKAALEAVEKGAPYPVPPDALSGSDLEFVIPIRFTLESVAPPIGKCK